MTQVTTKAGGCKGERSRLAQLRRWVRRAVEVCVYADGVGFVQVPKGEARKLLKKRGGGLVGRYCDVFDVLFLEPCPF